MRIELACFSERGRALAARIRDGLASLGDSADVTRCGGGLRVGDWTAEHFAERDALVFVGAAGIAVRAVAPFVQSKMRDPAVVCVDECGRYAVPLLSGHVGRANALARRIAGLIGAEAVVTTATDSRGVFAIDDWAAAHGFAIANPGAIKTVSALLLAGNEAKLACEFPIRGTPPPGIAVGVCPPDAAVGVFAPENEAALSIVPPVAALGVGCRRGTTAAALDAFFLRLCAETRLSLLAVERVCSIDRKRDEPGLIEFSAARGAPFETFSAAVLADLPGDFTASPFVRDVTGVDTVCERAAVAGSGGGRLVVRKIAGDGIAMAAAVREFTVDFTPAEECP